MLTINRPSVKITHTPSGISSTSDQFRTDRQNMEAALKHLKSMLYAFNNDPAYAELCNNKESAPVGFVYDLPDDNPFPHELEEFKKENKE